MTVDCVVNIVKQAQRMGETDRKQKTNRWQRLIEVRAIDIKIKETLRKYVKSGRVKFDR